MSDLQPKPPPKAIETMLNRPQPHASTSYSVSTLRNPQLGPEPYFSYPTPSSEEIEDELPPYWENENVPLGPLLDRLVRKGYGDMRVLVDQTLPPLSSRQKPKHIIEYAKTTRQAVLKYLAVLRWKTSVDLPASTQSTSQVQQATSNSNSNPAASFPTPHSNGDSNDTSPEYFSSTVPGGVTGKGKGRMVEEDIKPTIRGKVTDAKRIQVFLEHQNRQHEEAVIHVKHTSKVVEGLRERNPDLLTALSLLTLGTYNRLPTSLTEAFAPKSPLTNPQILRTIQQLNRHLLYRIRCVDYVPPSMVISEVKDGRIYISGGGLYGWKAELTVVGFGDEEGESRWWLVGVEWGWRVKEDDSDDPGGDGSGELGRKGKRFDGEERQQILDIANLEVLVPKIVEEDKPPDIKIVVDGVGVAGGGDGTPRSGVVGTPASISRTRRGQTDVPGEMEEGNKVDAPLVRVYNLLQHLSLAYQLEELCSQAVTLSRGRWRGNLLVDMDRSKKVLTVKYWIRARPAQSNLPQQAAVGKKASQPNLGAARTPMVGGIISISLTEIEGNDSGMEHVVRGIFGGGMIPSERVLKLGLSVKWETGEIGVGGGLKAGDVMENIGLEVDPSGLNLEDILLKATRTHASHLTALQTSILLTAPRVALFPLRPPQYIQSESDRSFLPLVLRVPLPSRQRDAYLSIGVSALTGYIEIEDSGGGDSSGFSIGGRGELSRSGRARAAVISVNEGKARLVDDTIRLMVAIITDNLEDQLRQLGYTPSRRLSIRSQDLLKTDLHPATTIFVPLPTSSTGLHYFVAKVTSVGVGFELLKLSRVGNDNGVGVKLVVGDRSPLDLGRIRARRGGLDEKTQVEGDDGLEAPAVSNRGLSAESAFQIEKKDLKEMFIFCNALVAQTVVEQQLKDRSIPYTQQYPPSTGDCAPGSKSAVAGMVPTLCVKARDLLKDGYAGDVAYPTVYMSITDWWKGGKCQVVTIVRLRHGPSMAAPEFTEKETTSSAARAEGISFDQATSIVKFKAEDISRCVPAFLEQWERLSKVIVVAGEVNRLNKTDEFKDVKMLAFDLKTATLCYSPGYNVSITYTPTSDSYQVSFFRSGSINPATSLTPAAITPSETDPSPHDLIAPLLSNRLNDLTSDPSVIKRGSSGQQFIRLLKDTLPVLLEIEAIRGGDTEFPVLIVKSVEVYRLIWDVEGVRRYALDITLLPSNRYLIKDGSLPDKNGKIDLSCGPLTPIEHLQEVLNTTYTAIKSSHLPPPSTPLIKAEQGQKKGAGSGQSQKQRQLMMKVDSGKSLVCCVSVVGEVLRSVVGAVQVGFGIQR